MIYTVKELLEKLRKEHKDTYYYRGQTKKYETPLWPSMYRGLGLINTMELPQDLKRRCNWGVKFGFKSNILVDEKYSDPKNIELRELKRCIMGYVRNGLGYCLSESMFQQAGWESEGLDVTSDINIAMFFATHSYYKGKYNKELSDNLRVIYRWEFPKEDWNFNRLNESNYYNSPRLFPSAQILDLFDECDSISEFQQSIHEYRNAIGWNADFDYMDIQGKRPFNLIKIPTSWKSRSRIVQQSASLIFPDSISYEEFNHKYSFQDAQCNDMTANGGAFIEDLSTASNSDIFLFRVEPNDFNYFDIDDTQIYINDDISHQFLIGWMKSFHQNPYGTPNLMFAIDDNYLAQIDMKLNFSELRYRDNESLFNG